MTAAVFFLVLSSALAAEECGKVSSIVEEDLVKAASNLESKEDKAEDRIIGGEFVPTEGLPWQVGAAFHDWMYLQVWTCHSNYYLCFLRCSLDLQRKVELSNVEERSYLKSLSSLRPIELG